MRIIIFAVFSYCLFISDAVSQVHEDWVQRYNGAGNSADYAYALTITATGLICVTGSSFVSGTGYDYVTIVYNSSGVQQWLKRYDGPAHGNDGAYAITSDASGNVYITGFSSGGSLNSDIATIKYNSSGVQQWVQRYNGTANADDMGHAIAVDGSGNVYVAGQSLGIGSNYDYITIKYNSAGVQQWVQRYNGPGNSTDMITSMDIDNFGSVYVTGQSKSGSGNGTEDYATIKYNSEGVQQWVMRYNGPGNDEDAAFAVKFFASSAYVTGYSDGGATAHDFATIKYSSTVGTMQWVSRYAGPGDQLDEAEAMAIDPYGYIYVAGSTAGYGSNYRFATVRYNPSGMQQWVQFFQVPGNVEDHAYSIAVDVSGSSYVCGFTYTTGGVRDYATVKYNYAGNQQWYKTYHSPDGDSWPSAIAEDGSGNIYVTGYSKGNGSDYDFCTIKYSQQIGIRKISTEIPDQYYLVQNYPNPFNPATRIKFSIPLNKGGGFSRGLSEQVTMKLYDILGREITTLVNQGLAPGTYEVQFDGTNYPSGVYYYRLNAGGYFSTKKMVLIK